MRVTVSGNTLRGEVVAPASKSAVHRLLICAALADIPTTLKNVTLSQDIVATIDCLRALGAQITTNGDRLTVIPLREARSGAVLDCGESGSTLRFLLPIAAALGGASFVGRGRLAQRPLSPLYELLCDNGCTLSPQGQFPLRVSGGLTGARFVIDGGISSQFISGLLMAAPLLGHAVEVCVSGAVESRPYIDLTVAAMRRFGVEVTEEQQTFFVPAARYTSPDTVTAEGDWSNAAFWLVADAIASASSLTVSGLDETSLQGDRAIRRIIEGTQGLRVPLDVDVSQIPDLVPVLSVLAAGISGRSVIRNAARLRLKESDRLCSVHAMLTALGGRVTMGEDSLLIEGKGCLRGGTVDACNDHRIAMAAAVAATICEQDVIIEGAEAVRKSYPTFFKELAERGMSVCPPYSGEN